MDIVTKLLLKIFAICAGIILINSCSSQKENSANRALQNLSARYNYIYNSNIILNNYQEELILNNKDNYDQILPIYIVPLNIDYLNNGLIVRELDDITTKAQTIIAEKGLSNYLDDAYLLLGKANFYKGENFNAVAYFDYTAKTYNKNKKIYLKALNWKARSLMQLNNFSAATNVLDTIKIYLDSVKSSKEESLATLAQMSIYNKDYKDAIISLKAAIKQTKDLQGRTRFPYILAQLYEREKDYNQSLRYYTKVIKSNAPFEMYFNAKLSQIRINAKLNKLTTNRKQALLKLLKDDKNLDYTDQIYFEVAEDYFLDNDIANAIKYYQLSVQKSIINPFQKGLSYLKIADLNFNSLKDYVSAKLYYDSAVNTLPNTYPNYESIVKKGQNLEFITERLQIITDQDTLQAIAKLNEQDRAKKLDIMFEPKKEIVVEPTAILNDAFTNNRQTSINARGMENTFYFGNLNAISKGFTDFRKRWGNRQLSDNWRQSIKSSGQISQQNQSAALSETKDSVANYPENAAANKAEKIKEYIALLPTTPALLAKSDQQIIDSYFELANFYQQVLNEEKEAIKIYELLLKRYPQNNHLESIYYSLYLGYKELDPNKAAIFKNIILSKYPNSVFAKTILDPNFSIKQNALELEVSKLYNNTFNTYVEKDFTKVISSVNEINQRFPGNDLQAQYDYLKSIAIGRTQNVDSLLKAFDNIITNYPEDQLINPLVKDHIAYINANLKSFKARKIALLDFDPTEPPFISKQEPKKTIKSLAVTPVEEIKEAINDTSKKTELAKLDNTIKLNIEKEKEEKQITIEKITPIKNAQLDTGNTPVIANKPKPTAVKPALNNIFSLAESKAYFYVIAVADTSLNVSSSRFGIGQFNRGNYPGIDLKHQLVELSEDQLIYIGNFESLKEIQAYATAIQPLLSKIMKISTANYTGFYISKENFNKLKNKETINKYLEFFKNNY